MSKTPSVNDWKVFYKNRGLSDDVISIYSPYISKLKQNNVPVIFELEHLSKLLKINIEELCKMINSPESFHREFSIPKRKGGKREIVSPYPSLLHCQRWIYKNILLNQKIHKCAHGFTPKKSIFTNSSEHLSQKALLKMDLKNFFPSILINWVIKYFSSLGFANNVSFYLSSLCCYEKHLSQGSSTSPYLTNILLKGLDKRLYGLSQKYDLKYTRYADDLAFSGNYIPYRFIDIVTSFVDDYGLEVNEEKTRLHTKPGQRILTGLSVAGEQLKLPRSTKRQLRKEIYFIKKYGFLSHISKNKIKNPYYLESLNGKFNFWLCVEPDNEFVKEAINHLSDLKYSL